MISVEGYKAFHGDITIKPKNMERTITISDKDFLYKPDFNCWYGGGRSFGADIVVEINDYGE